MAKQQEDFIGTGWGFPPSFALMGEQMEMVSGAEEIQQSLEILLTTRTRERLYHDDFGCELSDYLFEEIDQHLISSIRNTISEAILYHEPRIEVEDIDIDTSSSEEGLLLINIHFIVNNSNSRYNMVFPFYLKEAI